MSSNPAYETSGRGIIHVLLADGQQSIYEEAQVRGMLARQVLTPDTYFWREGMAEWRPLSELPPLTDHSFVPPKRTTGDAAVTATPARSFHSLTEQGISPAAGANSSSPIPVSDAAAPTIGRGRPIRLYDFDTNPVPLTIVTLTLMVISLGATTFFLFDCLGYILDGIGLSHADVEEFIHYFLLLIFGHVVVEILFFFWVYYTNENSRRFTHNMTYSSGWAVGCFFVPILNLFRPYQVMQEIWKVSESPASWYGTRDSIFVGLWFAIRLLTYLLSRIPFHTSYADSDDPGIREIGTLVHIATTETCMILMELTTFILISVVTWRHVQLVRRSDKLAIERG